VKKFFIYIAIFVASYGISLLATAGIIKLITICFGLEFSWRLATGIWLLIILLEQAFGKK
jgi:predicted membrane metal-binding protein